MKTLIISDLHIGSKGCKTDEQIKELKEDSDKLKEEIRAYFGDAEKLTYFGDTVATL